MASSQSAEWGGGKWLEHKAAGAQWPCGGVAPSAGLVRHCPWSLTKCRTQGGSPDSPPTPRDGSDLKSQGACLSRLIRTVYWLGDPQPQLVLNK